MSRPWRARALGYAVAAGIFLLLAMIAGLPLLHSGIPHDWGTALALISLGVSTGAMYQSWRAWRWQETDVADLLPRLVREVAKAEQAARDHLLGRHDKPIDIEFKFRRAPAHNVAGPAPGGQLSDVVHYYTKLRPRRLVIIGAPGSGKTVLAMELILALIEEKLDDPLQVPVRLSATTWRIGESVDAWLKRHLVDTYKLSLASAVALVDGHKILPVVDGLDEMDADPAPGYSSYAGQVLRALNAYQRHRAKANLIITCRDECYKALQDAQIWAHDSAHIHIAPVSPGRVKAFLDARTVDVSRWQPVLDIVENQPNHPLTQALSTPWRLTLAVVTYEQREDDSPGTFLRDPADLTQPALATPDGIRDHLLALFIPAAVEAAHHQSGASYRPDSVHRWLAVLAAYLERNIATPQPLGWRYLPGADIVLHELWPLAGAARARRIAYVTSIVLMAVALSVVFFPSLFPRHSLTWSELFGRFTLGALGDLTLGSICAIVVRSAGTTIWPTPSRLDLGKLRTSRGRWQLVLVLIAGLVWGTAWGFAILASPSGPGYVGASIFATGTSLPILAVGIVLLIKDGTIGIRNPRMIVTDDLICGFVAGVGVALAAGLLLALSPLISSDTTARDLGWVGIWFGLLFGLMMACATGVAGHRYIALLALTRSSSGRWLPWRLGRFLQWCYGSGLIRVAGIGYQFRHRELQDYLARHPRP